MKKAKIDFITSMIMIISSGLIMLLPLLNINNIKYSFLIVMSIYLISNLINYVLVKSSKDREGLYTAAVSLICIALVFVLNIESNPVNLAIVLLIWTMGMSLVKLKKADYYHDRENSLWLVLILTLFIFIFAGLLTAVNLYCSSSVQVLMIGNFFFINGVLDMIDPIINYIKEKN